MFLHKVFLLLMVMVMVVMFVTMVVSTGGLRTLGLGT